MKPAATFRPIMKKVKQAGQSIKVTLKDSEFIDNKCIEIVPDENDASLSKAEISMLLVGSASEDEIEFAEE